MSSPSTAHARTRTVCAVLAVVVAAAWMPISATAEPGDTPTTSTTTTTTTEPTTTSSQQPPATPTAPAAGDGTGGLLAVLIVALVLVALALVAAAILLVRYRRTIADRKYVPQSAYAPPGPTGVAPAVLLRPDAGRIATDRDALAATCIQLADAVRDNPALVAVAHQGLSRAGYMVVDPTGERFDSRRQEALQARPTGDPSQDGVIVATPRVGYVRDGRVIRQPGVVILQYRSQGSGP